MTHGAILQTRPPPQIPRINLAAVGLMAPAPVPPPAPWTRLLGKADLNPLGNNVTPDCVEVGIYRIIQAVDAKFWGKPTPIQEPEVIALFKRIGTPVGTDVNKALLDWARTPIVWNNQARPVIWARVRFDNPDQINMALFRTPLLVTLALPQVGLDDISSWNRPWPDGAVPLKGHAAVLYGVNPDGSWILGTWGLYLTLHQSWIHRAVQQVDCMIPGFKPDTSWAGFDLADVVSHSQLLNA